MGMAALRGDENHRLKENNRERLRKKDWRKVPKNWEKEKACQNERRADGTSDLDKIKDLTRGDLSTRLWKRPGFDWHTENHEQHWQAAVCKLYLCAGIGWNEDFHWEVAFIHVYNRLVKRLETSKAAIVRVKELQEQCEHGEISKEEKLARFVFIAYDAGGKEERDEMESVLKNNFGLTKVGRLLLCMQLPEGHGDRAKCQSDLAGWFKDDVAFGQMEELFCTFVPRHTKVIGVLRPKLHKLCSLHWMAIECKVPFVQVCIQPFENKHREEAIEYQRANAEGPLLLGVLPFEEAFLEWFVEKGPDDLVALKEKFEKLYLEEKKERMKKLADTHIKVTVPHFMLKGQDKDLTLLEDLKGKQIFMNQWVGLKLNVPQHVLFGQDKNLVLLEDLEEKREVMGSMIGIQLNVPEHWFRKPNTDKPWSSSTRPWRCTVIDADLPSASDSDPYFKIKCNDPNEPDEHLMLYSEVRTYWIVTKSKRACRIVKPDLSTAGDEDPSFEIECCDGSDVASPRTMKYRVVKKHWTFNTRNVVCKLVRADLDSAGNDDPRFFVQEWVKEEDDKGDDNDEDDGEDEHSGCEEVEDEEGGRCDSFSAIDEDSSTESEPAEPEPEEDAEADPPPGFVVHCSDDEDSCCQEVEDEEGGRCDPFFAIDEDSSTESEPAEPEPEVDAGVDPPFGFDCMRYSCIRVCSKVIDAPVDPLPIDHQLRVHCNETLQESEKIGGGGFHLHSPTRDCGSDTDTEKLGECECNTASCDQASKCFH